MQHKGEIVERAVRESGIPISKVAKRMGKSRKWMYNSFANPQLSIDYILGIGKIIGHDFSKDLDDIKRLSMVEEKVGITYVKPEEDAVLWKNKYYELLDKYTLLLEGVLPTLKNSSRNKK
jgi:hypothetical protein